MARKLSSTRKLMAIGGHEDRCAEKTVLREFVRHLRGGKIVVASLASQVPEELWREYREAFRDLGVKQVVHLLISERKDAMAEEDSSMQKLDAAGGVFFTGGDQLRITSKLGGTPLCERIQELYREGVVIGGTSAGASVLTETMIISGPAESHRIGNTLLLAPGLGFIPAMVIDQHFGERGRIGRLLGVVAQNPRALGIGIDENTAVILENEESLQVIGDGAVYVLDCRTMTYTNISEEAQQRTMSVFGSTLHVLSSGDTFDIPRRFPIAAPVGAPAMEETPAET